MQRTTKSDIYKMVEDLQRMDVNIYVGWAYGQPRATNKKESVDLSPRLPMGEMMLWLSAYRAGVLVGLELNKQD